MSVINNVLKNLESRQSHFTPIEINSLAADSVPARNVKPLLLIGVVLVLLAAIVWAYLQGGIFPATTLQPVPASASIAPVEPEPVVEPIIEADRCSYSHRTNDPQSDNRPANSGIGRRYAA